MLVSERVNNARSRFWLMFPQTIQQSCSPQKADSNEWDRHDYHPWSIGSFCATPPWCEKRWPGTSQTKWPEALVSWRVHPNCCVSNLRAFDVVPEWGSNVCSILRDFGVLHVLIFKTFLIIVIGLKIVFWVWDRVGCSQDIRAFPSFNCWGVGCLFIHHHPSTLCWKSCHVMSPKNLKNRDVLGMVSSSMHQ